MRKEKYTVFVAGVEVDDKLKFDQAFELAHKAHEIGFTNIVLDNGYVAEPFENLQTLLPTYPL